MPFTESHRAAAIKESPTMKVSAKAAALKKAGQDIIALTVGEPDFPTPDFIKQAAHQAIDANKTLYTPPGGIPDLLQAIQAKLQRENNLNFATSQITASVGAKESLFAAILAIVNPGDEVIIPAPYWVSYLDQVLFAEGKPVVIKGKQDMGFKITPEQLEQAITPQTRILLLNSPSNPSGLVYTKDELKALSEVLLQHPQVMIISDDIYEYIVWEPIFCNLLQVEPKLADRFILINGVSKAFAMTGWRIGYAAGPQAIIQSIKKILSQSSSCPTSISQYAAIAALNGQRDCVQDMVASFQQRHDYLVEALNTIPHIACQANQGTFYAFVDVQELMAKKGFESDIDLAESILTESLVASVPGSAFGYEGYLRLSYATSLINLQQAVGRLHAYAQ